jgi:hypothetical protein
VKEIIETLDQVRDMYLSFLRSSDCFSMSFQRRLESRDSQIYDVYMENLHDGLIVTTGFQPSLE